MNPPPQPSQPPQPAPTRERPPEDLARAAAENVLLSDCGQCHGSALTQTQAQDGINFIDDIDALVQAGLIVPMSSAASRIIVVMRDGSMPPRSSGLPPVVDWDIDVVASYIDNQRFWPDFPVPDLVDAGTGAPAVDAGADGG
jgi:mono/diheme cytochrome c family protein